MGSLPRLLIYLAWMWSLLHTLSGTPFASFFWVASCLRRLSYSQTSMYLSFPHHFSALLLSRNIVRLFFAYLLSSRCAYRGMREPLLSQKVNTSRRYAPGVAISHGIPTFTPLLLKAWSLSCTKFR